MGKFITGFLLGGILLSFCSVAFLPDKIIDNVRGWFAVESQIELPTDNVEDNLEEENNVTDVTA